MSIVYLIEERGDDGEWGIAPDTQVFDTEAEADARALVWATDSESPGYATRWVSYTRSAEGQVREWKGVDDEEG